jgi:imidazolonepropionase-like amidohydrolase
VLPGYTADLILIDGDPTLLMSDVRKVRHVLRGDRLYESAAVFKTLGITP